MSRQPHVLFILSDQHNRKLLGCAGDGVIRTPHLDRLAAGGIHCQQAYTPSPLCVPARMALLSGLPPMTTGVHRNSQTLPSHIPTIAHSLGAAGYRSVLCGRMHFLGPDQRHGFRERLVGDHGPTTTAQSEAPMGIFDGCTGQDGHNLKRSGAGWSSVQAYDKAVCQAAVERIAQHHGDPLFMTIGFYGPHNPFVCSEEQFHYYLNKLPPLDADEIAQVQQRDHPAIARWRESRNLDAADGDTMQRARAAYYGACETIDQHVGAIVAAARERWPEDEVMIIYASDHGDMAGERGLFWKSTFFEGSVGVPWIINWPGQLPAQKLTTPVSLLDLAPTLSGLLGAPLLPGAAGRDLSLAWRDGTQPAVAPIISTLSDRGGKASAMIRRGPWKLIHHHGYPDRECYQLDQDPDERHDRGRDPTCGETCSELDHLLLHHWDPQQITFQATQAIAQATLIKDAHRAHPEDPGEQFHGPVADYHLLDR